jgi:hypothetical protein
VVIVLARPVVVCLRAQLSSNVRPHSHAERRQITQHSVNDVYCGVLSIYETPTFVAEAAKIWSTEERLEFFAWIANEPEAGVVIPGSGGCRKVRWARQGMGKQGGTRVIYFAHLAGGELVMLLVYPKAAKDNIPAHILRQVRQEIEDDRS